MPLPTDVLGPAMIDLLDCAISQFEGVPDDSPNALPGRTFIQPGLDVAWDDCCEGGGQLWVRVISTFPTGQPFPSTLPASRSKCDWPLMAVNVGVGIIRCSPGPDNQGRAPSGQALSENALVLLQDRAYLEAAVRCCWPTVTNVQALTNATWAPLGPNGGCAGGEWTATLALATCRCP